MPVEQVWPWLAQLGQDRGGFYSYERLENVVGCRMPSADRVHPEYQHWQLGDKLWMYPPEKLGRIGHAVLAAYVPGRALGFATRTPGRALSEPPDGSWSFVLEPLDARTTRLLVRGRGPRQLSLLGAAAAFQVLTLAQPTPPIGAGLLAGAALLLREPASAGPESADL